MARRDQTITELVKDNQESLLKTVRRRLSDQIESDDVMQDTLVELIEAYDVGDAIENLGAWLAQVAQNKILDCFRRQKTRDEYTTAKLNEAKEDLSVADPAVRGLIRDALVSAINQLPEEQKEVFILTELEGQNFETIAEKTGVNINTLLARKRYAILSLRNQLKEIYDELE